MSEIATRQNDGATTQFEPVTGTQQIERFWSKVQKTETCWLWTRAKNNCGYGVFVIRHGRYVYAHRFAYELLVGPIPEGLELDHVKERGCISPACVNPAHLEPVTHAENNRRAATKGLTCKRGHEFTDDNVYWSKRGTRQCRTCARVRAHARYHGRQR